MKTDYPPCSVRVWGDFACFTMPETKVERVSYPLPTPSAARGILEAIFWKPEFKWRIKEIWVLKPINYFSVLRNEVKNKASERAARNREKCGGYIASADRSQRHTLALRNVDYIIRASIELIPGLDAPRAKYTDQFQRRVSKGRCFSRPYLGCREFAANFAKPVGNEQPISKTMELGLMLYDLDYQEDGRGTPNFFEARMENGILRVPSPPWEGD